MLRDASSEMPAHVIQSPRRMTCSQHHAELASCIADGDGGKLLAVDQSAASMSWLLDVGSLEAHGR